VVTQGSVLADTLAARSAIPVVSNSGEVVGIVVTQIAVDDAFMDGLQKATGLAASVYVDNKLSATSLLQADGESRPIGTILAEEGKFLNTPYFAALLPVLDMDGVEIAKLWVGRPQMSVFAAAARSVELTFLISVALMVLAIVPAGIISRYLANQFS